MKSKKVTMLAAALVVAVVALAGVGYAATTYKATTVNINNEAGNAYVLATQGQYSASFNSTVDLYTYTEGSGSTISKKIFSLVGSNEVDTDLYGVPLGTTTITVNPKAEIATYKISALSNKALPEGWSYVMKYVSDNTVIQTGTITTGTPGSVSWTSDDTLTLNEGKTITVTLYIAGPAFGSFNPTVTPTGYSGLGSSNTYTGESTALYTAVAIAFTLDATTA